MSVYGIQKNYFLAPAEKNTKKNPNLRGRVDQLEKDLRTSQEQIAKLSADSESKQNKIDEFERQKGETSRQSWQAGVGDDGFYVADPTKKFSLSLGMIAQIDGRVYINNSAPNAVPNSILARRLRPIITFKLSDYFKFRLIPDFAPNGQTKVSLFNAEADITIRKAFKIRVGYSKTPFDLEILKRAFNLTSNERAYTTALSPNRDNLVQIFGEGAHYEYQVALLNGVVDGNGPNGAIKLQHGVDSAARLILKPFATLGLRRFRHLAFGLAATVGTQKGDQENPTLPSYKSLGQLEIFNYRKNVSTTANPDPASVQADGLRWRLQPQLSYLVGPFSLFASYGLVDQAVSFRGNSQSLRHEAWLIQSSILIGAKADPAGPIIKKPLGWKQRGPGALELHGRYTGVKFDRDSFSLYADPESSVKGAQAFGVGINWLVNGNVAFKISFDRSIFSGGAKASGEDAKVGNRSPENALFFRLDFHI